jgi:hypothetical protein
VIENHLLPQRVSSGQLLDRLEKSSDGTMELLSNLGVALKVTEATSGDIFVTPEGTEIMSQVRCSRPSLLHITLGTNDGMLSCEKPATSFFGHLVADPVHQSLQGDALKTSRLCCPQCD